MAPPTASCHCPHWSQSWCDYQTIHSELSLSTSHQGATDAKPATFRDGLPRQPHGHPLTLQHPSSWRRKICYLHSASPGGGFRPTRACQASSLHTFSCPPSDLLGIGPCSLMKRLAADNNLGTSFELTLSHVSYGSSSFLHMDVNAGVIVDVLHLESFEGWRGLGLATYPVGWKTTNNEIIQGLRALA